MAAPIVEFNMAASILNCSMGATILPKTRSAVNQNGCRLWLRSARKQSCYTMAHGYLSAQIYYKVIENFHLHLWRTESTLTLADCQFEVVLATGDNIKKEMPIPHRLLRRPTSKPLWRRILSIYQTWKEGLEKSMKKEQTNITRFFSKCWFSYFLFSWNSFYNCYTS